MILNAESACSSAKADKLPYQSMCLVGTFDLVFLLSNLSRLKFPGIMGVG